MRHAFPFRTAAIWWGVGCLLLMNAPLVARGADDSVDGAGKNPFLRLAYPNAEQMALLERTGRIADPIGLETGIVRFVPRDNQELENQELEYVDLIAAVHIGEPEYYRALNEEFRNYDVVLYELVADKSTKVVPGQATRRDHPVNVVQGGLQDALGLAHQLDSVDYSCQNFVRADMTPSEFAESMRRRDESFGKLFFRMMGNALAMQSQDPRTSDLRMLSAMFHPDRERHLKLAMAEQLYQMGGSLPALDGPQGSTIITERNKKALEGLRQQIAWGRKKIAIFYGAAHMLDIQRHVEEDFGLRQQTVRWLLAWNLDQDKAISRKDQRREALHE